MSLGCIRSMRAAVLLLCSTLGTGPAVAEDILSLPNLVYRTGPFSSAGIPLMNGQRDYMMMINERDGGINGVRLGYEECETGYSVEKGLECYEKTKTTGIVAQPSSTGIAAQLLPRTAADRIPLLAPGYGFSPVGEGKVFKWAFNPPVSSWDGAYMMLSHLSGGDLVGLRGKKIVLLHLDVPYGREAIPFLEALAQRHAFTLLPVPVGVKEMQNQSAQWQRIGEENPDFVLMWGWGTMNAGALAQAVKTGFPMEKFVGIWWSGHDGDLKSVGEAATGYRVLSWNVPISDSPAMQDVRKYVLDPRKPETTEDEADGVFYQRGVLISMFVVEAIRVAQERFDNRLVTAEQLRWGLENLKLDDDRLAEIGMTGMLAPFSTSCEDHSGHAGAWMLAWDGSRFVRESELLHADQEVIAPMMRAAAEKFAAADASWVMNEACAP